MRYTLPMKVGRLSDPGPLRQQLLPAAAWALLSLFGLFLAYRGWGRWQQPLIDFGPPPYLGWQILEGRVFGRDFFHGFGPLSSHVTAGFFSLLGPTLLAYYVENIVFIAVCAVAVNSFTAGCASSLAALLCTGVFLALFAFAHLDPLGN